MFNRITVRIMTAAMVLGPVPTWAQLYTIEPLDPLPGGNWNEAHDVNNAGHVVGRSDVGGVNHHAFLWLSSDDLNDLGTHDGNGSSTAYAINDNGQIVGYADKNCNPPDDPCTLGSTEIAFLWDGGMIALYNRNDLITYSSSRAYDLNNDTPPRIVGSYTSANFVGPAPMVWQNIVGQWHAVQFFSATQGEILAIDGPRTAAGWTLPLTTYAITAQHATWWTFQEIEGIVVGALPHDIGSLCCGCEDQGFCGAGCVNDTCRSAAHGVATNNTLNHEPHQFVGMSYTSQYYNPRPFLFEDLNDTPYVREVDEMLQLFSEPQPGTPTIEARDINACGQVVGHWYPNHAFLWHNDQFVELNTLIGDDKAGKWKLDTATAINDIGQIVGYGRYDGDNSNRAFLMTPSIDVVDPYPALMDGAVIADDADVLAMPARPVDGLTADGITRVALRIPVSGNGCLSLCVKDDDDSQLPEHTGTLSSPLPTGNTSVCSDSACDTLKIQTNGKDMVVAVLTSPLNFVRHGTTSETLDRESLSRTLTLTAKFTPEDADGCGADGYTIERTIDLHRPPVLFLHGIWGTNTTFDWELALGAYDGNCDASDGVPALCRPGSGTSGCGSAYAYKHAYKATNAESFRVNIDEPLKGAQATLQNMRDRLKIAATQVDVIAHSMGGLLSRIHAADLKDTYYRDDNFDAGDFHKLITVGTPHFGSPWGCSLLYFGDIPTPLGLLVSIKNCTFCGGLYDMRPQYCPGTGGPFADSLADLLDDDGRLPEVHLPVAVLSGSGGHDLLHDECGAATSFVVYAIRFAVWYYLGFKADPVEYIDDLFDEDEESDDSDPWHDIAVTVTSQLGGHTLDDANHFDCWSGLHVGIGGQGVPHGKCSEARAVELLNASASDTTSFPNIPQQSTQGLAEATPEGCPDSETNPLFEFLCPDESPAPYAPVRETFGSTPLTIEEPLTSTTITPGDTIAIDISLEAGFNPVAVLVSSGLTANGIECSDSGHTCESSECQSCDPGTIELEIPVESVGRFPIGSFAHAGTDPPDCEDLSCIEAAAVVRPRAIPDADVTCVNAGPQIMYISKTAPRQQIDVLADYDDGITRDLSGCRVPDCCDQTCGSFEQESCDSFIENNDVTYAALNSAIADVDCQGFVTGRRVGQTFVQVTYTGSTYGACTESADCECTASKPCCSALIRVVVESTPCETSAQGPFDQADVGAFARCYLDDQAPGCPGDYDLDGDGDVDDEDRAALTGCYVGPDCDCNGSTFPDYDDILDGTSPDLNENGVPDECESAAPGIEMLSNGYFNIGFALWTVQQIGAPLPQFDISHTECYEDVLHLYRLEGDTDGIIHLNQPTELPGLDSASGVELNYDVRIDAFTQPTTGPDTVPVTITIDTSTDEITRSYCLNGTSGCMTSGDDINHTLALDAGVWHQESIDLSTLSVPVSEITDITIEGSGGSYELFVDNVSLRVNDDDCDANGIPDASDLALGFDTDDNANGTPDACDRIIYVDADATGADSGLDWSNAYDDLQEALTDARTSDDVLQIWVATGTYKPTPGGLEDISFRLVRRVGLYGGFAGNEDSLSERDISQNTTTLSGTLVANNHSRSIVETLPGDDDALIDGFVITGAMGSGFGDICATRGGGICIRAANTVVRNCTFVDNFALWGGAVAVFGANARLQGCTISHNEGQSAGAVFVDNPSASLTMDSTLLSNNTTISGGSAAYVASSSSLSMTNCTVADNDSLTSDPAVSWIGGSSVTVANSILWNNGCPTQFCQLAGAGPTIDYSIVEGWTGSYGGTANNGDDPLFFGPEEYRLISGSPAIDSGDNAAIAADALTDVIQNPRLIQDTTTPDTGNGQGPLVDRGAYEMLPDCDSNGAFDGADIAIGTADDCNVNGIPDECDIAAGLSEDTNFDGIPDECLGACDSVADCADSDGDGIRDDNCVWTDCVDNACLLIDIPFADMGGQFGSCMPDGTADGNDRFMALNCFANAWVDLACELFPPAAYNIDAGGSFGDCNPDGVCDGNDAFLALNAFAFLTTCSCPLGGPAPVPPPPPVVGSVRIALETSKKIIAPGDLVEVEIYMDSPLDDIRGYQLHVRSGGGKRGDLELVDFSIHQGMHRSSASRPHVFAEHSYWSAFNLTTAQMVAGLDTEGVATAGPAYLVTMTLRASKNARGSFFVDLLHDDSDPGQRTFLFPTAPRGKIAIDAVEAAVIDVRERTTR